LFPVTTKDKQNQIHVIHPRCKGCNFCVEFWPQHVLFQSNETNAKGYNTVRVSDSNKCTGCGMCSRVCPEFAIFVETPEGNK